MASAHFWHFAHRQSLNNLRVRQLSWRVMRGMLGIGGWLIDSVVKDWRVMRGVLGIGGWLIDLVVKDNFNRYVFLNFI